MRTKSPRTLPKLLNFLFPDYTCLACNDEIYKEGLPFICGDCEKKFPYIKHGCAQCGRSINTRTIICDRCEDNKWEFSSASAVFDYCEPIKDMILKLKYGALSTVATAFAPAMCETYYKRGYDANMIVPVPLCAHRQKERGYNQAELLANEVSNILGISVDSGSLIRTKKTAPQKEMTINERQQNLKDAFSIINKENIHGKKVLIVDDVITTCTTINECAKALKKAGAQDVFALSIAITRMRPQLMKLQNVSYKKTKITSKTKT